ncbi:hypothetical protein KFE25_001620 [Diacronema lutheri]|uniref:Retinoblastoma-associated protein B-box domain-containing protein n=2 Tax=Diacronema lutheri TaxID=2081491 RepID=A0A8J6C5Q7_DIALT|nr:hypothetical protein KFE25_001620 [Diacronema lutheri]
MAQNAGAPPAEATGPVAEDSARAEETLTLISTELARFKPAINMLAVNEQVRRVVQYVLAHNYDLLEGRHPDQLVIAAVYGVCKIHSTDVTFKDLVQAYKTIAATSSNMWLAVPLVRPGSFGNIIAFYNDVFVPRCKDYLHGMKDGSTPITVSPSGCASANAATATADVTAGAADAAAHADVDAPACPQGGAVSSGAAHGTLVGSPNGFRVKRQRVAGSSGDVKGAPGAGADGAAPAAPAAHGAHGAAGAASAAGGDGNADATLMGPPLSPTRRPAAHVPRSPYVEYPASPFKRPAPSPIRPAATSPRRAVPPSPLRARLAGDAGAGAGVDGLLSPQRKVPAKYGQVTLSPARAVKSPLQHAAHTPRTAFFRSTIGTPLGAPSPHGGTVPSPCTRFDAINEKLKSPNCIGVGAHGSNGGARTLLGGGRSPVPRRMATQPLDFERRRPGPSALGGGGGSDAATAGQPRISLAAQSALLALADASSGNFQRPGGGHAPVDGAAGARPAERGVHAARGPVAGAPVPDSHRMQDLAVASVLLSADDGQ